MRDYGLPRAAWMLWNGNAEEGARISTADCTGSRTSELYSRGRELEHTSTLPDFGTWGTHGAAEGRAARRCRAAQRVSSLSCMKSRRVASWLSLALLAALACGCSTWTLGPERRRGDRVEARLRGAAGCRGRAAPHPDEGPQPLVPGDTQRALVLEWGSMAPQSAPQHAGDPPASLRIPARKRSLVQAQVPAGETAGSSAGEYGQPTAPTWKHVPAGGGGGRGGHVRH